MAFFSGQKVNAGTLGVTGKVVFKDCEAASASENGVRKLISQMALRKGKGFYFSLSLRVDACYQIDKVPCTF